MKRKIYKTSATFSLVRYFRESYVVFRLLLLNRYDKDNAHFKIIIVAYKYGKYKIDRKLIRDAATYS